MTDRLITVERAQIILQLWEESVWEWWRKVADGEWRRKSEHRLGPVVRAQLTDRLKPLDEWKAKVGR